MFDYKMALLKANGFEVGARDPKLNPAFPGRYMVHYPGDFCIVGDDLQALMEEAVWRFKLESDQLHRWDFLDPDPDPLNYILTKNDDQITVTFENDAVVWIEKGAHGVTVHCYRPDQDEPMNVEIHENEFKVWTDG